MDGNWASRICCRECGKPAPQRIANAARAAAKRSGGGGGGGNKSKGDDVAELAEVRSTIKGASVATSGPTSRRGSTVESDDGDGNGGEEQGTAARRERLGTEIQELRKVLGPDHVKGHEAVCRAGEPSTTTTVAHEDPGRAASPREGHQESRVAAERAG